MQHVMAIGADWNEVLHWVSFPCRTSVMKWIQMMDMNKPLTVLAIKMSKVNVADCASCAMQCNACSSSCRAALISGAYIRRQRTFGKIGV